jgi:hypothetical protein
MPGIPRATRSSTARAGGLRSTGRPGVITVANGTLLNYEAATSHTVTVRVTDRGGLTYQETFTINLTNVNDAPTGTTATVTFPEDTSHTFTSTNFGFSDADAGDSFSAVRIDTVPTAGRLTLSGVAVTAGQVVSVADLTAETWCLRRRPMPTGPATPASRSPCGTAPRPMIRPPTP